MVEAVICLCGILALGGITKICCDSGIKYSEEYYRYLRNNKKAPEQHTNTDYYRYL